MYEACYSKPSTISADMLWNHWQLSHIFSFCFYILCYDSVCISILCYRSSINNSCLYLNNCGFISNWHGKSLYFLYHCAQLSY